MGLQCARAALAVAILAALGACAAEQPKKIAPPTQAYRPALPPSPPSAALGRGMKSGEAVWHMRSALNVAALSCRERSHRQITANYNQMLRRHRATLAEAYAEEQAIFRARFGKDWQQRQDKHLTALYNRYALLATRRPFCAAAMAISARVNALDAAQFRAYSGTALAELERPGSVYLARE